MSVTSDVDAALVAAARRIATEVAAPNAVAVDKDARFPAEAVEALGEERAFSALVPTELGGA